MRDRGEPLEVADISGRVADALADTARVSSSINFSMSSGESDSANRTVIPWLGRMCANSV